MRAVLRQPLPYFVLAGVAVFVVDAWLRRSHNTIEVNEGVRREVSAELTAQFGRPATADEERQALASWVTTELLFREASTLGLEQNDAVIRAHLANKLKQLVKEGTIVAPATEEELQAQLVAEPQRYAKPDSFRVSHAFVNRNIATETFETRAAEVWAQLNAGAELHSVGDHFPRGPVFEGMTAAQLESAIGVDLGSVLKADPMGTWHRLVGPRGVHFVRLDAISSGKPDVESARAALLADVEANKRDQAVDEFVEALQKDYRVVHEAAERTP